METFENYKIKMGNQKQADSFNINFYILKVLGVYPLENKSKLYTYYSIIFLLLFNTAFVFLCTVNLFFLPMRIDDYIEELIFYFTEFSVLCKVFTFTILRPQKIREVLSILESDIFQPDTDKTIEIITYTKAFYWRYWKMVFGFSAIANAAHVFTPLLTHFILKTELILPVSTFTFLPDDVKSANIYAIYMYQTIGIHFTMHYAVNVDTFFSGLMIFMIAQLEVLGEKLRTITDDFKGDKNKPFDDTDLIKKLNQAIIHHDRVIKYCGVIEEIFTLCIFVQFGVASCVICICLYRFTLPATYQYYIFLTTYSIVMIIVILVPCFFGTRIMDKSCMISHAIYSCDWTWTTKRFKTSMLFLAERANRPLTITGMKMFQISLITFTSIMNSAYSFFTLLRHMQTR